MSNKKMTIAQGMKELKLIDSKVEKRRANLKTLCAYSSDKKPAYETKERQTQKVAAILQSILDLITRKGQIKAAIQKANLETKVSWQGKEYTLQEVLYLKQQGAGQIQKTLLSLEHSRVEQEIENTKARNKESAVELVLCYDPIERERKLETHMDLQGNLDVLIDQANHNTLIEVDLYEGDEFDTAKK